MKPARITAWLGRAGAGVIGAVLFAGLTVAVLVLVDADEDPVWEAEVARLAPQVNALPTDLAKTTFLREYVGSLLDIGRVDSETRALFQRVNFDTFDPAVFYPLFESNQLPADCGITTFFYIKLLHRFGFKAYQYSFGFTEAPFERYIHSVVLIEIDTPHGPRLVVQDPYLNSTFRDRAGEPLDFRDMLTLLGARDYDAIVHVKQTVTTSLLIPDARAYADPLNESCRAQLRQLIRKPDGAFATVAPLERTYATMMMSPCDDFEAQFESALRANAINEPFIFAYRLRTADMVGSEDHATVQQLIDATLAR